MLDNSAKVQAAEILSVLGGTAFAVAVSSDVAVHHHTWVRVVFGVGMVAAWVVLLAAQKSTDTKILGRGFEEFKRVLLATGKLLGLVAIVLLVTGSPLPRQTLLIAIASGLGGCLLAHVLSTVVLVRQRTRPGGRRTRLLLVGTRPEADRVAAAVSSDARAGYEVSAFHALAARSNEFASASGGLDLCDDRPEDPVVDTAEITELARAHQAQSVVITSADRISDECLRDLRWALHPHGIDLMVVPGVAGIAQPKLSLERLSGLSLLRVDEPGYSSLSALAKALFDRVLSVALLALLSPLFLAIAVAVKAEDGGPVFYRPARVGRRGEPFRMWKFRSMHPDAEARLTEVRALSGKSDDAFYKWAGDPRITRIGRVLRRTSLDELPQLINVAVGEMSLIGPRPMVDGEGAEFPGFVQRRLLVKPGMTGLWQVSGRSDISEQDRVRLDLYYVENWSMDQDLRILARTAVTVARGHGAY
ncbi:sugar transferase [Mycolicibacterium litorale]|uniref:Polyprenyl glycosylphosphotransferase n=1 Tax=Mycolicibacterium litorale TaxID=758802 RepID=A0AAD1MSG7_9MYCO|nr:sugar transferase [Mycolicibacterium litorale]MCV7416053.1 sugar transferase [Mycolicibacterium litorale]TDY09306.1 exopolysaccharide biosynthesis polyprenyl glycosylphosphotransferase [Mycolicibacterium litorale]BBY17249.1 polyprenyl glycosylphosphotransferase [Mycolicibacterium litorale]